jgi:hypothetical protein
MDIPKLICWKIWLVRNKIIFREEVSCPISVANKEITQIYSPTLDESICPPLNVCIIEGNNG